MAISGTFMTEHGIQLNNAYLNLHHIHIMKDNVDAVYYVYKDRESYLLQKPPINIGNVTKKIDFSQPVHVQMYNFIKTKSEFEGWLDC